MKYTFYYHNSVGKFVPHIAMKGKTRDLARLKAMKSLIKVSRFSFEEALSGTLSREERPKTVNS
jgi:hypothetical protein